MAPTHTEPLTDPKVAAGAAWWVFGALSLLAVWAISWLPSRY